MQLRLQGSPVRVAWLHTARGPQSTNPARFALTWRQLEMEAVIDTGFNGFLTLSSGHAEALGLTQAGSRRATLANVYLAQVRWHDGEREVLVIEGDGGALPGMSMLHGNRVCLHVVPGGEVRLEPSL